MSDCVIACIVTEGTKRYLMVLDGTGDAKRYPVNTAGLARLAAESSAAVLSALQKK